MKVRLTRKLADEIDGVNLSGHEVGEVVDVSPADARLLFAERWAVPERRGEYGREDTGARRRADDRESDAVA